MCIAARSCLDTRIKNRRVVGILGESVCVANAIIVTIQFTCRLMPRFPLPALPNLLHKSTVRIGSPLENLPLGPLASWVLKNPPEDTSQHSAHARWAISRARQARPKSRLPHAIEYFASSLALCVDDRMFNRCPLFSSKHLTTFVRAL